MPISALTTISTKRTSVTFDLPLRTDDQPTSAFEVNLEVLGTSVQTFRTSGTNLDINFIASGSPVGGDRVVYDGSDPNLVGIDAVRVLPFDIHTDVVP